MPDMKSELCPSTYHMLLTQSGTLPFSPNTSCGVQGHIHSWLADFLSFRSQRVALNGVLSFPLPVQAGVPQGSVLGAVLFLAFINDLSDSLENPLYLFASDFTLCHPIPTTVWKPSPYLVSQQSMEVLDARNEIRAISVDILRAFDMVWHPALLTKLSSYGIQGHLHSWLTDFLSSRSQCLALNGNLSSPLPVQDGVPQGSVLGPVLFLVFISDLSNSLENPLYLFADDSTLCRTICHPSDRQAAASSLSEEVSLDIV